MSEKYQIKIVKGNEITEQDQIKISKVNKLVDCFSSICAGEELDDCLKAGVFFLAKMKKMGSFCESTIEEHAEFIKKLFIVIYESIENEGKEDDNGSV